MRESMIEIGESGIRRLLAIRDEEGASKRMYRIAAAPG